MAETTGYIQQMPGGLCFAHGPYDGMQCPKWPACVTDEQKPEFIEGETAWRQRAIWLEAKLAEAAKDTQRLEWYESQPLFWKGTRKQTLEWCRQNQHLTHVEGELVKRYLFELSDAAMSEKGERG